MIEEIEQLAKKISGKRVVVQLPEGLKDVADEIVKVLEEHGKEVILDVDPFFGSCDLRLKEAESVGADAIIHVGHLPMINLPNVYYVEWKRPANEEKIVEKVRELARDQKVCVATTANFRWILSKLTSIENVVLGKGGWRSPYEGVVLGCDTTACSVEADINAFVGDGYFHPLAIWVNTRRKTVAIRPDGSSEEVSFEKLLRKRLALMGMIEGKRVGIGVSSKLGQNRRDLAFQLKKLAEEKGYKVVLFVSDYMDPGYIMGLNVDFVVYTGCPRVPIDDQERYSVPVLTPEEFLYKLGVLKEYRIGWITQVPL